MADLTRKSEEKGIDLLSLLLKAGPVKLEGVNIQAKKVIIRKEK